MQPYFLIYLLLPIGILLTWLRLRRVRTPHTAAGGAVMALGIFALASGRVLLTNWKEIWQGLGLAILLIWGILAFEFLTQSIRPHRFLSAKSESERFAFGTWVAGTAVLASVSTIMWSDFPWLGQTLTLLAFFLLLFYTHLFLQGYIRLLKRWNTQESKGEILLASVSIQSVILAFDKSWPNAIPHPIVIWMNCFSSVLLVTGLALILIGLRHFRWNRLAENWSNTNCILHGSLSITGLVLASIMTDAHSVLTLWILVVAVLIMVEAIELARAIQRIRRYGWKDALACYHVSQWSRNFTFGMFYAFSLQLRGRLETDAGLPFLDSVLRWGPYVVLSALAVEIGLFLWDGQRRSVAGWEP